jgi:hypothetical protein
VVRLQHHGRRIWNIILTSWQSRKIEVGREGGRGRGREREKKRDGGREDKVYLSTVCL